MPLVLVLGLSSALFADTLYVPSFKKLTLLGYELAFKKLENMTRVSGLVPLKDGQYYIGDPTGDLVYRIDGETYRTSMFEIVEEK